VPLEQAIATTAHQFTQQEIGVSRLKKPQASVLLA